MKRNGEKYYLTALKGNKEYLGFIDDLKCVVNDDNSNPKFAGTYWQVIERVRDINTGEVAVKVEYWTRVGLETFVAPATQLLDSRSIKGLLHRYGINTLPSDTGQCVAYAQIGIDCAPEYVRYKNLGWSEYKGQMCFFSWKIYQAANAPFVITAQPGLFDNYKPVGTLETLLQVLEDECRNNPVAVCALAVAAASPIWGLIYNDFPDPSFVINFCGMSSSGKTILQQLCASFAGNCCLTKGSTLKDFNTTGAAFYRQFNGILGFPIVVNDLSLDDNNRQPDEDDKRVKVMRTASGNGKLKCANSNDGNHQGLQEREFFSAPFLFSSVRSFFSEDMTEDVMGRLLEIRLQNFCLDEVNGNRIREVALANRGLLADRLIPFLFDKFIAPGKLNELKKLNREHIDTLSDMLVGCPKHLLRLAQSVAVLLTGAELLFNDCLGLNWSLDGLRQLLAEHIRLNSFSEAKRFTSSQLRLLADSRTNVTAQALNQSKSIVFLDGKEVGYIENRFDKNYASLGPKERLILTKEAFDHIFGDKDGDTFALRSDLKKWGLLDCDDSNGNQRHTRRLTIGGVESLCYAVRLGENFQLPGELTTSQTLDNPGVTLTPPKTVQTCFELKPLSAKEISELEDLGF